jgi:hypothetical protein
MGVIYIILGIILYSIIMWWVCGGLDEKISWSDYLTIICVFPIILCIRLVGSIIYLIDKIINEIYGTIHGR